MASRVQRDRKPSSKLQPEKDDGPLLEIRFTEEESNGKRMKLTQSFAVLKPKDIDTGKEKSIQELEELKKYAFFYTHHKAYYPAVLLEIKRQKRRSTTIEEDVDELQDENQGDNDSEDHEKTKPRTKKQKFEKDQTTEEPKSASSNQEPKKNNAKKKKTNDETEAKKNKEQRDRENNMKKAKAKTTSVLGQEILNKTDALKDLGVSDDILDQFVDADMMNYNISRMDESEDFEIEECSKTKHVEDPPLFQQQSENKTENRPAQINLPLPAISKDFEIGECSKTKHIENPPLFQQQIENKNENRPAQINLPSPIIPKEKKSPVYHNMTSTKDKECSNCSRLKRELEDAKRQIQIRDQQLHQIKSIFVPDIISTLESINNVGPNHNNTVISSDSLSKSSKVQDVLPNVTLECGNVTPSGSKPKNTQLTQLVNKFTPSTVKNGPLFKEPSASVLTSGQSEQTLTPPSKEFFTVGNNVMKQLHPRTPHILLTDDDILKLRIASKNLKEWRPFVNELLSMKFTKEELAMSSAEGKENRKTKTSKPALNPFIIKELIAYTTTKWPYKKAEGDKPAEGCSESLCKRTINNKCGSARKLPKQKNDA